MDTGVVTIQEPVSTKTNVGEAPAGVIFDPSSMDIHKVNLSAVLNDEITSGDHRNNITPETDGAEFVNGSGNKETEELKPEKGEATKTISAVDDCKIVNDDQDSVFVHEPQSFNKTTEDEKIILSGMTLEKKKEDDITGKPEEVSVEKPVIEDDQTETKLSTEQEEEINNISKGREDIPIKTDEVTAETDSRTVETSVNGTKAEHNATVSAEQISRNGDNIGNETVSGDQTTTNGEQLHDVETTKIILLEVKKEDEEAEPLYKPVVENANIVSNEETTSHESKSLNGDNHQEENDEPVEAIKNSDDAEHISREVTVDKEKEEDITPKTEEVQESPRVLETPTIQGEVITSKASLDHEDTEEHENVLVRDIPQGETLETEAKTVDTSTVDEAEILKTKVGSSDVQAEVYGEHTEPCSSEIKDESHGREESIEVKSKETVPEKETATEVEKEEDKEEMKIDEEPIMNAIEKAETVTIKTVTEDPEIVNVEESTVHESESFKKNAEPVETVKYSEDADQTSREVTVDRETEGHITKNIEEVQESPSVIETSEIQGENIESKASPEPKEEVDHSSNETEEHEHVLGRDLPQGETLEVEAVETKDETKPSLDLKAEVKEKDETETVKTVISSDEVRPSAVQEEEIGEHTKPCSTVIKDESHGREESVEIKSKETIQDESTAEKHEDLLDVPSTESEKYQDNEPEPTIVANTEIHEKFEGSPSDLVLNVDKEEQNDETIKVDQVDGTQLMEEQRGLDSNGVEAEQIDRNRTDDTEESPVAKQVSLPEVEPVEKVQKPSLDSPSQVSEETSKTVDAKIDEKPEEEKVTLHQEDQEEGSYDGLETKEETISAPDSSARSVIDLTPLQEESSEPNEQKEETKLEKSEPTNEEVKSDKVIELSSASLLKELEGETVVEAEKIENKKENEEEPAAVDNIQKSLDTVETVESHSSLPSSSEEQGTVSEKIEDEKVEEETMVQIKSHLRQEEVSKDVEEQTIYIEPSLTEKCSEDQNQPEEQVEEACSRDQQEKEMLSNSENIVNEKYALHSAEAAEEETATNGETLHDVENTKTVLLEVEKEEEEAEIKTDAEPRLDAIEKEEIETAKKVVEDIEIVKKEEATAHESETLKGDDHQGENEKSVEAFKNSDEAAKISSEVIGDRENDEDITQKAEEVQESPRVIEIPTIQGEDNESKASPELKEEVDQSSKDTEQHEHVLERDIPQCETLEAETVDTSAVQEAAILNTLETNISETEAVHSETSLDLKVENEQKEAETVKTVILSDEVRPFVQVDGQAEEFGENTEPCTSEIKDESQGKEESIEVKSKESVQDVSSEEKDVNLLEVRSGESEKDQENEPVVTSLVSKIESGDKFEESVETTQSQTLVDVESVEKVQTPSLETLSELSEKTSKTVTEKIEDKPKEEVTLHQEGQEEGSNGLETNEETVSVPESRELGEETQEEESCLQNEQEKEVKLQKEQVDKHEPTKEELSNDQQIPVEEKSDEVIQVSSASPSAGPEDETVVEAVKIGEEQVADKDQKVSETVETSSLPSSSEEQEHVAVHEKTDGEEVKKAEPIGDSERGLEIAETTHLILPSADQKDEVKAFDEETQIPSVTLPLDEQEKVTSTEKGETKANETEDDKSDKDVESSTSPLFSEKNDDETHIAEEEKRDEEITVCTSKTSENVCMQQDEFEKLEATKLEELKEDKSQEIAETTEVIESTSDQSLPIETSQPDDTPSYELVSEKDDQTPKQVEEIYEEEHKVEATVDRNLPVETSQAYQTTSSDLVSALNNQTPKQVEETHEKETKEEQKIQAEEILHTENIPREPSDDVLVSMLASKEDGQLTLQEDNCADNVRETKDTQEEQPVSVEIEESVRETKPKEPEDEMRDEHVETPTSSIILEKNDNETQIAEAKKGDEDINEPETAVALGSSGTSTTSENMCLKQEEVVNPETPKLQESKEEKGQEIPDTYEAIEATGDQTLSSELVSGLGDLTPRKVEKVHEEEANEERKFEATVDQSLPVETSQEYQTPSSDLASGLDGQTPQQVEEVHEEETKEEQKSQVAVDHILLPVETSQADHTPSLISEHEDQASKKVGEILEDETKEAHKVQAEEIFPTETVPRESFSEAPVSLLASGEDEPVTPQEGNTADDTKVEHYVSTETEERVGETKPKESEAQGTENSDDQVETSTKLTKVEDESTKKTDVEVAELTNDYPTEEAEHGDETYSTLPVVGILTELQTTLETEREINDSASSVENVIIEPAEKVPKTSDAEVQNEKDSAAGIIEANMLQQDESGETEKIQEENGLAGKSLPVENVTLQEDDKEEVKVQDVISREFEVSTKEKIQEEETREIAEKQEESKAQQDASLQEEHQRDFEISKKVADNSHKIIDSESPADQPQAEQKIEIHETFKKEDQIVDFNEVKKSEEVQDEKLGGLSATTDTEQKISSEAKKDQEYASELGLGHDFASPQVEKVEEPHSLLGNDEEINEVVTLEKQITDPVVIIKKAEHESNEEHFEPQAISDDTKSNSDRDFPTEEAPKDQREEVNADKSLTKEALDEQIQVPSAALLDDQDLSVQKPSELIQSHQSPNQIEETSFEVKKTQEDKNKETGDALIINENVQGQDQPKDFDAPAKDKETSVQEQKSKDLTDVQEDTGTNFKPDVRNGHDSVVALKEESGLIEEKREVENVKAELEDAIKHEVSVEEKNDKSEKIDQRAAKEIYQEESKQTSTVKEEIKEKEKQTNQESFNNVKKADNAIEKTQPDTGEIESLSSDSKTQDKSEQKDEVPNQQEREITDKVPKLENPKIAEELQQKGEESESTKDFFSEVKETEPTLKEPARKSLSDLIQKVKGTKKPEDATTEPHIEEEPKTVEEDENEDGDHEHEKDDKTSPDSIVMVEAKDTVSIIKTHKKSQGILSGVGSKVKHSISKVKKVLTGKSSHTTKPSSPK